MAQQQLVVDGVDVLIEGEGPETVVMIHGWPDTHRLWDAQVAHLKGTYRCVRFTLPGFGTGQPAQAVSLAQMVSLFKQIVDRVSPHQAVTLLLHDWGCMFGYEFAAQYPQQVKRIIGVDIGDSNSDAYLASLAAKSKLMIVAYQLWLALAWKLGGKLGTRMSRNMAHQLGCSTPPALIGAQMNYPYYIQWTGTYGGYRHAAKFVPHCPMLYIYGKRKPLMFHSPRWLDQLAALPGCETREFSTGHWVMVEQPAAFNQCVGQWLERSEPVASSEPALAQPA